MRPLIALAVVAALFVAGPVTAAEEPVRGPLLQEVDGSVALPSLRNVTGAPRRAALIDSATNGVIGWAFNVDHETWNGTFTLEVTDDPSGAADFDIIFYDDAGSVADDAPSAAATYANVGAGGEAGEIPEGAVKALVYLGESGYDAAFSYDGYAPAPEPEPTP